MKKTPRKFELEVHLGLLAIIFVLLVLDAASNYVAYQARSAERDRLERRLSEAALTASRRIDDWGVTHLSDDEESSLRRQLGLSSLEYFPGSLPTDGTPLSREGLIALTTGSSDRSLKALTEREDIDLRRIMRGETDEYFYLYPMAGKSARGLIILGQKAPLLAYLDTVWRTVVFVGTVAALLVLGVYGLLSRFVLSPFRKIRQEALLAGRTIEEGPDEVEAMVSDYSTAR